MTITDVVTKQAVCDQCGATKNFDSEHGEVPQDWVCVGELNVKDRSGGDFVDLDFCGADCFAAWIRDTL